ncbi:MAG: polyprenyl synthetase family protein [Bdellovibrionota bacterium]
MSDQMVSLVLSCPELQVWPELEKILTKRKQGTISLCNIAYTTTGNSNIELLPIQAAILCFVVESILIDDVLDKDEKGMWKEIGVDKIVNLVGALHARQQLLICESKFSDHQKQQVTLFLNQMMLVLANVQELATHSKIDLARYWKIVHGKSGNVCGTAMRIGALLGEVHQDESDILYSIGKCMGEIGQISNDLRGAFQKEVNPDWKMPGSSLPILLALTTEHEYSAELKKLLEKDLGQIKQLERAKDILIKSGAVSLCCDHISQRLELLYQEICKCNLPQKKHLHKNIGEDIQNAIRWVKKLDIELSEKTQRNLAELEAKIESLLS